MSIDRLSLTSETTTRFKIDFTFMGRRFLYGFGGVGHFHLTVPERFYEILKIDGRYWEPFCEVNLGRRSVPVSIGLLARNRNWFRRHDGLRLKSWREIRLKRAQAQIVAALEKEKHAWDRDRFNATSGNTGRAIV